MTLYKYDTATTRDSENLMSDREYYKRRADAERAAAQRAKDSAIFLAHMKLAREYDWLVVTEPRVDAVPPNGNQPPHGPASIVN